MEKRKGTMTERERIEALLRRKKPDRVPICPVGGEAFAVIQAGHPIADAFNNPEVCYAAHRKACEDFGWVFWPRMEFTSAWVLPWGGEVKYPEGQFTFTPTNTRRAVETPEEAMKLQKPDVRTAELMPLRMKFYNLSSREPLDNKPWSTSFMGAIFSQAGEIPGVDIFSKWLIKNGDAAHKLLRLVTDFQIEQVEYWKDTFGIENVLPYFAEPSTANQIISPRMFEQFALPYIKELTEKVLAMGFKTILMHICGEQNANLPYWAQVSFGDPGILSFGHEVDFETASKYFPNHIILGNLEPAIIQTGTPEGVYEASRKVIEKGKRIPSGFIFSSGCTFPPRAPRENVMAMTRAVNDFGWYD
ncbi:Uroporphyrinogen decarboxylase [subsurface metagenome]